jgi:hypothetical protein
MNTQSTEKTYVLCVANLGYETSLIVRRLYEKMEDTEAESHGMIRVVDESGQDYLFPRILFESLSLPHAIQQRLAS